LEFPIPQHRSKCSLSEDGAITHVIFNAYWEPLEFELPDRRPWKRWIDTTLDSPNDIVPWREAPAVSGSRYAAGPRSVVVLHAALDTEVIE
jgi:isoamylase